MSETRPVCVWPAEAILGESVLWHSAQQCVYWVDIKRPAVHAYDPVSGKRSTWPMPEPIGCIAPRRVGGFIAGLKSGLALLDLDTDGISPVANPEPDCPGNRFNDGKCDDRGRFWAGTMDDAVVSPSGWLYRLDPNGRCQAMDGPYVCTNGPAFAPGFRTLYHTDTIGRTIYAFDLSREGMLSHRRVFARFGPDDGYPDGMTTDRDGFVWVAHWGGWRVTRFAADGRIDSTIRLPVAQVTNCAFGGSDLGTLYITSAREGLDAAALARQPLAGGLFEIRTQTTGLACQYYGA